VRVSAAPHAARAPAREDQRGGTNDLVDVDVGGEVSVLAETLIKRTQIAWPKLTPGKRPARHEPGGTDLQKLALLVGLLAALLAAALLATLPGLTGALLLLAGLLLATLLTALLALLAALLVLLAALLTALLARLVLLFVIAHEEILRFRWGERRTTAGEARTFPNDRAMTEGCDALRHMTARVMTAQTW
jgi:hypothetical protein